MANRMIRDEILESEVVLGLPAEVRWFFIVLVLTADDLGLFEATSFKLARRATLAPEQVVRFLAMLADADLIRLYEIERKRYGLVPKFRQKLQIKKTKCPLPPAALYADDDDMRAKVAALLEGAAGGLVGAFGREWEVLRAEVFFRDGHACVRCANTVGLQAHHLTPKSLGGEHSLSNLTTLCSSCNAWVRNNASRTNEIKDLVLNPDTGEYMGRICANGAQTPELELEQKGKIESSYPSGSQTLAASADAAAARYRVPACPNDELVALYHHHLPVLPAVEVLNAGRKRALSARWREVCADGKFERQAGVEWFAWFFARVAKSDFLMGRQPGRSGRTWAADFDFLLTPSKFARVVEGRYHQEGAKT